MIAASPGWVAVLPPVPLFAGLLGFLAGSIPFGLLVARLASRSDPRRVGSGNVGATNVARTSGIHAGLLTLVLDALKGALPAGWMAIAQGPAAGAAAGLGAVLGHCFTPWLRLRGGKGVATLLGIAGALAWPIGLIVFVSTWLLALALVRRASVASLAAAWALPAASWWSGVPWVVAAAFAAAALVVTFQHRQNLRRLFAGTEPRFPPGRVAEER